MKENRIEVNKYVKPLFEKIKTGGEIEGDVIPRLHTFLVKQLTILDSLTHYVFQNNREVFGYRLEDMKQRLDAPNMQFMLFKKQQGNVDEGVTSGLGVVILYTQYLQVQRKYIDLLDRLTFGTMADSFTAYFPIVINPNTGCPNKGDTLSMKIGVGSYNTWIDHRNSKIIVEGDTLAINEDAIAVYKRPVDQIGEQILELKCKIYNPTTGEISMGEGSFYYRVY